MDKMDLQEAKRKIDLAHVVEAAGIQLQKSGPRYVGSCPFHEDRNPSLTIYPGGRYHCFGCGASGDCFEFVRNYYNLDFPGALKFLGVKNEPLTFAEKEEVGRRKRRHKLLSDFRSWEREIIDKLSLFVRATNLVKSKIKLLNDAVILDKLEWWEYLLEIMLSGDEREKLKVYSEAKNGRLQI